MILSCYKIHRTVRSLTTKHHRHLPLPSTGTQGYQCPLGGITSNTYETWPIYNYTYDQILLNNNAFLRYWRRAIVYVFIEIIDMFTNIVGSLCFPVTRSVPAPQEHHNIDTDCVTTTITIYSLTAVKSLHY